MKQYSAAIVSALGSTQLALATLVLLEFPSGTRALNTTTWNLVWNGVTYLGAAGLGSISPITDAPGEVHGLTLGIDGGPASLVSLALDEADEVQGAPCTILTAIVDPSTSAILDAPVAWRGTLDTMPLSETGDSCTIQATAESSAVDLLRGTPMSYTHADQQALFPGDRGFEYVTSQAGKPITWPAREYFFK